MPERFGRYELLERIGKGGMAEVFRARLQAAAGAEKILVIKRILPSYSSDPEFIRMFVNEAKIALPLTHGNITSTFDFGEEQGLYYLAMEYIHGQNLGAVLDRCYDTRTPIPIPAALYLAAEVAKGLAYAHGYTSPTGDRVEIVHLDVSPQNILVSYNGTVKLVDFGISKVLASTADNESLPRGKVNYVAPEQLIEDATVDRRADIFSLGSVLYTLLTGHRPFEGSDDAATLQNVIDGEAKPVSQYSPQLAGLDVLLLNALAKEPEQRFADASEFQVAATQALFGRDPSFGGPQLGEWMRDLFAWDIYTEKPDPEDDPLRDRLLFQLSKAKVELPEAQPTDTRQILALPTVSIPSPDVDSRPRPAPKKRSGRIYFYLAILVAVLAGAGLASLTRESAPGADHVGLDVSNLAAGHGLMSINSWPSATVELDGERRLGKTPILRLEVPAGEHTLTFYRRESGLEKEITVEVPSGGIRTVVVSLER